MADDQQNVDPVCFPLIGCELHFSGIQSAVLLSLALHSSRCAIESRIKVREVEIVKEVKRSDSL